MSVGVVVLCAGLGTRLRPLTERIPKPVLPVLDVPLIRRHFRLARSVKPEVVTINSHHLPEVMRACARSEASALGLPLCISHEDEIQGTGGGIRDAVAMRRTDTIVVLNGDTLFDMDLPGALQAHRSSGAAATMVLAPMPRGESYAAVECDRVMRVRRIASLGPPAANLTPWHFTGVHILSAAPFFEFVPRTGPVDINRGVYPEMLEAGRTIAGHIDRGYWSDVGTPDRLLSLHRDFLHGQIPAACTAGTVVAVHRQARVHPKARIGARTYVGPGAEIGEGAVVGPDAFVGTGALVPSGATVKRAVVLAHTALPEAATVQDEIVMDDLRLSVTPRDSARARK